MQFLITATFALILLFGVASSCPSVCSCTDTSAGVSVDCSSRGLGGIPTYFPYNTYELKLQNNEISVIEDKAFNNLLRLYRLWLNHNNITVIEGSIFFKSIKLKIDVSFNITQSYLYSNNLTSIQSGIFNDLPKLYELYLSSNKITSIQSGTFNDLPNLYNL